MSKRNLLGLFITIEALDFAGKTTQFNLLKKYIEDNFDVEKFIFTREPGGTEAAEKIREVILNPNLKIDPLTEAYLYAAARSSHVSQVILPNLQAGKVVISDRYLDSSLAYQGFARELGVDFVKKLNKSAIQGILPSYTIFLDGKPEALIKRFENSKRETLDRIEAEGVEFQHKCREGFYKVIKNNPDRFWIIDASLSPEEIFKQIQAKIDPVLNNFFKNN